MGTVGTYPQPAQYARDIQEGVLPIEFNSYFPAWMDIYGVIYAVDQHAEFLNEHHYEYYEPCFRDGYVRLLVSKTNDELAVEWGEPFTPEQVNTLTALFAATKRNMAITSHRFSKEYDQSYNAHDLHEYCSQHAA